MSTWIPQHTQRYLQPNTPNRILQVQGTYTYTWLLLVLLACVIGFLCFQNLFFFPKLKHPLAYQTRLPVATWRTALTDAD